MFEYQTAISELTGLPVSNASRLRGPERGRRRRLARAPAHRQAALPGLRGRCTRTAARRWRRPPPAGARRSRRSRSTTASTRPAPSVGDDVAAVFLGQPNFLGAVEDLETLSPIAKATGALLIVQCDPLTLGVLRPPGDFDVDIAVGEGQTLGNRLDYGGPCFGFFAAQQAYLRRMPGRIAGETTDVDGRRGFVLTLQTREQHIRREKATHNICTAQALNALAGDDLPELAGPARDRRARRAARLPHPLRARDADRAGRRRRAARRSRSCASSRSSSTRPSHEVIERCAAAGVNPGYPLEDDGLLVAITEQRSKQDIDRLAEVLRSRRGEPSARRSSA